MKENTTKEEDEDGLRQCLDALDLDWHLPEAAPHQKNRAGSAPPTFDSSSLFLYMEDDVYTRSFTKGFLNTRKDNLYSEFYEQYKHKNPTMPPPFFQEDFSFRDPKLAKMTVYRFCFPEANCSKKNIGCKFTETFRYFKCGR